MPTADANDNVRVVVSLFQARCPVPFLKPLDKL